MDAAWRWRVSALVLAFASLAGILVESAPHGPSWTLDAAGVLACGAIAAGLSRYHPAVALPWRCWTAAIAFATVGNALPQLFGAWIDRHELAATLPSVSISLALACFLAGIVCVSRGRTAKEDWGSELVDTAMLVVASVSILWEVVAQPLIANSELPGVVRAFTALNPALDAVLAILLVRLLVAGRQPLSRSLLMVGVASFTALIAFLVPAIGATFGSAGDTELANLAGIATFALVAIAAQHPSMVEVVECDHRTRRSIVSRELWLMGAIFAAPTSVVVHASMFGKPIDYRDLGVVSAMVIVLTSIRFLLLRVQRERAVEEVVSREKRFRAMVEHLSDHVLLLDQSGSVRYVSPSMERLLGFGFIDLVGRPFVDLCCGDQNEQFRGLIAASLAEPGQEVRGQIEFADSWCTSHVFAVTMTNLLGDRDVEGITVVLDDVTDALAYERQLRDMALHDPLTGLPNRTLLSDRVEQLLAIARRNRFELNLYLIDVDDFGRVNAAFGHRAGDALLAALGARLSGGGLELDTVGRLGDDDFLVASMPRGAEQRPEEFAERLLGVLREPFALEGREVSLTASIGVASASDQTVGQLLNQAGTALRVAKSRGKNTSVLFHPRMQAAIDETHELTRALEHAVERGELSLVFQPTFGLGSRRFTGVEALLRWDHPGRGRLQPGEFVPLAESCGAIVEIGRWVLTEACTAAVALAERLGPFVMAVNLSPRQLESDALIADVEAALAHSGLDPRWLVLEVTETAILHDAAAVAGRLEALKRLGIRIAIDDFGTGYCSLSYLRQFPVDILKIDRSFVAALDESPEAAAIVHTIVELARVLDLEVIAEGVETERQFCLVEAEGCDAVQGFLFATPLEVDELCELLDHFRSDLALEGAEH